MEELKQLGLTNTEIKIYITLLELGPSLASAIAKKSLVNRAVTYHVLENLIKKGLVSYVIKENRKYFNAAEPKGLLAILKEKEETIKEIIPRLDALKKPPKERFIIEVFEGKEGFKTVMNDVLKEGKEYFILGFTGKGPEIAKYWYAHWQRRRIKKKILRKVLFPKSMKGTLFVKYPLTKAKFFPENYQTPASALIYGKDKVLIFLPLQKDFAGIRITNKKIFQSYKAYFNLLWEIAKK